ncbi:berberine/berberine-like, FAD-binding, type 2 [Artemisia annua]|uniref:Berberine/berberine-like, FAD-binding, type 2 n=1 Tax=Artemisia annua TaxID=35608 RepID=A0A2U1LEM6_ARTAN|nr:berberine/berberine-like, FAD-binding, type 2 [Artemisia annua]
MQPQRSSKRLSKAKEPNPTEKQQEEKKETRMNAAKEPLRNDARLNLKALCISGSCRSLVSNLYVTPGSEDFISCLRWHSNNFTSISQLIFTTANSSFLPVWQAGVNNARFNQPETPKPSVIVTPVNESQVRNALLCTKKHGYEIRIRSGGHDFEGLSSTADVPFVMIDFINMRSIDVDVVNSTVWVQAGAALGEVYYTISQKTDTLYFPAGLCPTVGIGGYLGGGGYGNLLRKYGLGADNVVDVRFMDVNGDILDRSSMGEELFWAIRGGGASSFGIVLAWKLRLVPVPELVTVFVVNKTLEEGATEIFHKFQTVMPNIDRNLHIRIQWFGENVGNTTKKTIKMAFEGIYQGTSDTLIPLLEENFPELNVTQEISISKLSIKGKSDYIRAPISIEGLKKIWEKILENDGSATFQINPFGGIMNEYSETTIPYPHRAGVLFQLFKMVNFGDQPSYTTPTSLARRDWLQRFEAFLEPYVSSNPREAYFNYIDLDLGVGSDNYEEASVWGERYWKSDNFKKLIRIKARVDPDNFFRHPQSIPIFSTSLSDM